MSTHKKFENANLDLLYDDRNYLTLTVISEGHKETWMCQCRSLAIERYRLCEQCKTGIIREHFYPNYEAELEGHFLIVPSARIGVCDPCGHKYISPKELARWKGMIPKLAEEKKEEQDAGQQHSGGARVGSRETLERVLGPNTKKD